MTIPSNKSSAPAAPSPSRSPLTLLILLTTDLNGRRDAALDGQFGLVAQKHDAGKHLQDSDADTRRDSERDETIESILHVRIDAHNHTALARCELRKGSQMVRTGC